ncbi:MAG: fimbrillin family protein [Rikenellaceae bacterium]
MRRLITSLLVVAACVSCSKDSGAELSGSGDVGGSATTTTASITIATKSDDAVTSGNSFVDGDMIGIRIEDTKTEGNVHTHDDNAHVMALHSEDTDDTDIYDSDWMFYTGGGYSNELRQISLEYITNGLEDNTSKTSTCNIYAYSPFSSATSNFEAVSFDVTKMYDYMWAIYEDFNLLQANEKAVDLNFKHVMARFRFRMSILNTQSGVNISHIYVNGAKGVTKSGSFNAKTGEVNTSQSTATSITMDVPDTELSVYVDDDSYAIFDLYLVPMEVSNVGDVYFSFRFDSIGEDLAEVVELPAREYKAGESYTITLKFDNYGKIVFSDDIIEDEWTDATEDFEI